MTTALTPEQPLMQLVDDYAESRHVCGHHTYNHKTEQARKNVALRIAALEAELAAAREMRDYYKAMADALGAAQEPLLSFNKQLRAELAACKRDAERYRWLRNRTSGARDSRGRCEFIMADPHPLGNIMQGSVAQHLDAAIDAARAAQEKA